MKTGIEDAAYRALSWGFTGGIAVSNTQGMQWIVPQDITVKKLWVKTTSGTCTVRIKADATEVHSGLAVTSTIGSTTTFSSSTITNGQLVTLDVTASASGVDLFVLLECQTTSIA